jgi:acyl carrier protein
MLAALAAIRSVMAEKAAAGGGIAGSSSVEKRVIEIVADRMGVEAKSIQRGDTLVRDLKAKPDDLEQVRKDLEKEFDIEIPAADFKKFRFVGSVIVYVEKAVMSKPLPAGTFGNRPR